MPIWVCGHSGQEGHSRLCPHLVVADLQESSYHRVLRGRGLEYDMCCDVCAQDIKSGGSIRWLSVCEECVEMLEEREGNLVGWIGEAEVKEILLPLVAALEECVLADELKSALAVAPLDSDRFVAFRDGALFFVVEGEVVKICEAPLPYEEDRAIGGHHLTLHLHLSLDRRFAALCYDYGRHGLVLDLQEKCIVTRLDKGDYYDEHTPFPISFISRERKTLLIHATDWNRLDISDPSTGQLIAEKGRTRYTEKEKYPPHYLDYWHGRLLLSPDEQWIVDDGWVWGPYGVIASWNVNEWLQNNIWESEDGQTRRDLCGRESWNVPMAWIDEVRVAVWGIGQDEVMMSGARIFDVSTGQEIATFAGPSHNAFFGGEGRLFSVEEDGLHIWKAGTGERVGRIEGFKPKWQRGDFLIELDANKVRSWNWRTAFD